MSTLTGPDRLDPVAPWRLLKGYRPPSGIHDEVATAIGQSRPSMDGLVGALEAIGYDELASRSEATRRAVRDNGVTYNVYGDPRGVNRPWTLDVMPLVIRPEEWSRIEGALMQRSRLLNLILADLYGPQRLLRDGLVPPSLVLANPAFLRPCYGVRVPNDVYVHLLAVDLARSLDGQWQVIADRTQAPSGAGYALGNRIVLSRSLPEVFRDCHVQRLGSFFRAYRDALGALAPAGRRSHPRVVLLTPGPLNETYFEHVYLARYLGFTLVAGGDLTVRDSRVFIKTLEGLRQVDVILRRLDDSYCDPLELRSDSTLGVAGLMEAVRAGHVTVANALGSGLLEAPALAAFLPDLCRALLGEELLLTPARTRWCGDPDDLQYVLAHLDELVIKHALPTTDRQAVFGRMLSAEQQAHLRSALLSRPEDYVAQTELALSTAPVWIGQALEPRQIVVRVYVAAAGDSWFVLPGGLTRVGEAIDTPIVSMQRGGASKDTWIVSDDAMATVSLLEPTRLRVRPERLDADLPSRVADDLFWLGRHIERAEQMVRLLRSLVAYLTREDMSEEAPEYTALQHVLADLGLLTPPAGGRISLAELEPWLSSIFTPGSDATVLGTALREVHRISASVRDRLSLATWRILHQLQQDARLPPGDAQLDDVLVLLDHMVTDLAAFSGMAMESMTRGHGWLFLDLGRRLERSLASIRLIRSALRVGPAHTAMLEPLLEMADSAITYRRRYFTEAQLAPALDLLLADSTNPRALVFQLAAMANHLAQLPRDPQTPSPTQEQELIAHAIETVSAADFEVLSLPGSATTFDRLLAVFAAIEDDLRGVSDIVTFRYFSHAEQHVR